MNTGLPAADDLNISALSRLFDNTTNSYKLLFFQALLNKLMSLPVRKTFSLNELAVEMVTLAWYPVIFFHLSLGKQDKISRIINELEFSLEQSAITHPKFKELLMGAVHQQQDGLQLDKLLRYVPYHLQSPFFQDKLTGESSANRQHKLLKTLPDDCFHSHKPLYRFVDGHGMPMMELHPEWDRYLRQHFAIISGWSNWHWLQYLQARNPNTPALLNKISPPAQRKALTQQTHFWQGVMKLGMQVKCIFTDKQLDNNSFALDHFVPWSFVCHDQLWNLTPITQSLNSAKSNALPPRESVRRLASQHSEALRIAHDNQTDMPVGWRQIAEPYINDFKLEERDLLNPSKLQHAYWNTIPPLISLAEQSGFTTWHMSGMVHNDKFPVM